MRNTWIVEWQAGRQQVAKNGENEGEELFANAIDVVLGRGVKRNVLRTLYNSRNNFNQTER